MIDAAQFLPVYDLTRINLPYLRRSQGLDRIVRMHDENQCIPGKGLGDNLDLFLRCIVRFVTGYVPRVDDYAASAVDQVHIGAMRAAGFPQRVDPVGKSDVFRTSLYHPVRQQKPYFVIGPGHDIKPPAPRNVKHLIHQNVPQRRSTGRAVDEREIVERQAGDFKICNFLKIRRVDMLAGTEPCHQQHRAQEGDKFLHFLFTGRRSSRRWSGGLRGQRSLRSVDIPLPRRSLRAGRGD